MRRYRGPLRAVILDWAGTTVDYGSQAPALVLQRLLAESGIDITSTEARHSMGRLKKDQIRDMLALTRIRHAWAAQHGRAPVEADVENLFARFLPLQLESQYSLCLRPSVELRARECTPHYPPAQVAAGRAVQARHRPGRPCGRLIAFPDHPGGARETARSAPGC
ncbi:MAG: hypothetical protein HY235_20525 [Acidobacteria bacterium]|nr:hypothetical protein [Acidobacteriota bacterium]